MSLISFDSMYSIRALFLNDLGLPLERPLRLIECDLVLYRDFCCLIRADCVLHKMSASTHTLNNEDVANVMRLTCGAWCIRRMKRRVFIDKLSRSVYRTGLQTQRVILLRSATARLRRLDVDFHVPQAKACHRLPHFRYGLIFVVFDEPAPIDSHPLLTLRHRFLECLHV